MNQNNIYVSDNYEIINLLLKKINEIDIKCSKVNNINTLNNNQIKSIIKQLLMKLRQIYQTYGLIIKNINIDTNINIYYTNKQKIIYMINNKNYFIKTHDVIIQLVNINKYQNDYIFHHLKYKSIISQTYDLDYCNMVDITINNIKQFIDKLNNNQNINNNINSLNNNQTIITLNNNIKNSIIKYNQELYYQIINNNINLNIINKNNILLNKNILNIYTNIIKLIINIVNEKEYNYKQYNTKNKLFIVEKIN